MAKYQARRLAQYRYEHYDPRANARRTLSGMCRDPDM